MTKTKRSRPPATWVPLMAHQAHGDVLMALRTGAGLSRAKIAQAAGVNHATLRLAELEERMVRLTLPAAKAILDTYAELGVMPWVMNPTPGMALSEMQVAITVGGEVVNALSD